VLLNKGQLLTLDLPAINYTAELEISKTIYVVSSNGTKTISPIAFYFKTWSRETVVHAARTGSPPTAIDNVQLLGRIKDGEWTLEKAVNGLNTTFNDRGVPTITEGDLMNSIRNQADTLEFIVQTAII